MAIPEGSNTQLPHEHSGSLPPAHQRTGEMGPHSVTAEGKSAGSYLVSAIKAVAKTVFTVAFCIPLGISYLASKAAFTEGRLGGKADRVATKVARFFGEFYGTLKPSLAIKSTYHDFLKAHPHLNAEDRKTLDKLLEIMSSDRPDKEKKKEIVDIFAKLPLNSKLPGIFSTSPNDFSKLTSKKDPLFTQDDIQTLTKLKTEKNTLMMNLMRSISETRGHLGIQQHEAVAIAKITALIMIASFSHQGKQDIVDAIFNCPQELQTFFINNQDFAKAIASKISTNIEELQEILHQKKQQQQQQLNLHKFTQLSNKIAELTSQAQSMSASGGDTTQIQTQIEIFKMQQEEAALKAILYTDDLRTLEPAVLGDRSPEDIAKAKSLIDKPFDPNFSGQQVKEQFFCYLLGSDEGKKSAASFIKDEIKKSSQSQKNIIIDLIRQIPEAQQTEELRSLIPLCRT